MPIDDLKERVETVERHAIDGAVNLNVTSALLVALLQRLLADKMITPRFLDGVFNGAKDILEVKKRTAAPTAPINQGVADVTDEYLEHLRKALVKR
jgi:hypothetical protein